MIKFEYLINDNIVPFIVFLKEIPGWIKVENQKNILQVRPFPLFLFPSLC